MLHTDAVFLILAMALVTYIPRAVPAVVIEKLHFSPKAEKFLQLIPYTAMAALIFPGILSVDRHPLVGLLGGALAAVLAWKKCPLMLCVMAAIALDMVLLAWVF